MIYLIGETGAAKTNDETMANAMVELAGYTRCTEEEYWQRLREIKAVDDAYAEEA